MPQNHPVDQANRSLDKPLHISTTAALFWGSLPLLPLLTEE
jgi:hypothetical protein